MEIRQGQYILHLKNLTEKSPDQSYGGLEKLEATDVPRVYWLLICQTSTDKKSLWKKLILQNARSIQPALLELNNPPLLYLGVDEVIFILDVPTGKLLARYDSGTPVLWFSPSDNQFIFAVCELEVYALTRHGGLKWTANFPDVLKEVVKKGERLEVTDLSDQTYLVDILTGKMLSSDCKVETDADEF